MRNLVFAAIAFAGVAAWHSPRWFQQRPVVIDFEDLSTGGPGEGGHVVVTTQYRGRGVVFNSPVAIDYAKGAAGTFPHSPTKAIEQCFGAEFCTTPFQIGFVAPQRRVRVWAGYSGRLAQPGTVVLKAFDAQGGLVGQTTSQLPASSVPHIGTLLEVAAAAPNIVQVVVSAQSVPTNGFAIDDVEFEAGPPPSQHPAGKIGDTVRKAPGVTHDQLALDTVPDLVRRTVDNANELLRRAGLQLGRVRTVAGVHTTPAMILRQSPPPRSLVPPNTQVDVEVTSVSPLPPPTTVPNLRGLTLAYARERLGEAELVLGRVDSAGAWRFRAEIARQNPPAGAHVKRRSAVDVRLEVPSGTAFSLVAVMIIGLVSAGAIQLRHWRRWRIHAQPRDGTSSLRAHVVPSEGPDLEVRLLPRADPGRQQLRGGP